MYELFLTAFINDVDLKVLVSLLSGYAWDTPHERIYRVSYFAGVDPDQPKPITKTSKIYGLPPEPDIFTLGLPNFEPPPNLPNSHIDPAWKELSDILKRQSYIVTTRHLVRKARHFGNPEPLPDNYFDANAGALFWSEIPDPASVAGGQTLIMQRKKIELHDQLNLPTVLKENGFIYKAEYIEEAHDFYHRDAPVEFHVTRSYSVPSDSGGKAPSTTLLPFESLQPTVPGKWMLRVVSYVLDDHTPDKIQAARDALTKVKDELGPCGIQFKEINRRHYDTQLAATRKSTSQAFGMAQQLAGTPGSARYAGKKETSRAETPQEGGTPEQQEDESSRRELDPAVERELRNALIRAFEPQRYPEEEEMAEGSAENEEPAEEEESAEDEESAENEEPAEKEESSGDDESAEDEESDEDEESAEDE